MNTYYFGSSARPLYGAYHPPGTAARGGVLLCYPFGQEYMRAHRAFRQLALMLSQRGCHVLRFDYACTGDSGGDGESASLAEWRRDIAAAIDELKESVGLDRVSLVGLRLGAALMTEVAAGRDDLRRLVLWDPVVDGAAYLSEVRAQASHVEPHHTGTLGVNGFPLTARIQDELAAMSLLRPLGLRAERVQILCSEERAEFERLGDHLAGEAAPVSRRVVPSPSDWNKVDDFGGVLIPQALIREIVTWLTED